MVIDHFMGVPFPAEKPRIFDPPLAAQAFRHGIASPGRSFRGAGVFSGVVEGTESEGFPHIFRGTFHRKTHALSSIFWVQNFSNLPKFSAVLYLEHLSDLKAWRPGKIHP